MFKVKIINNCRMPTIINGKETNRNCIKGEDVFVSKIYQEDIDGKLYLPYRNQILDSKGETQQIKRERPVIVDHNNNEITSELINAANGLKSAINSALEVVNKIESMKQSQDHATLVPEEPKEIPEPIEEPKEEPNKVNIKFAEDFVAEDKEYSMEDYTNAQNNARRLAFNNARDPGDILREVKTTPNQSSHTLPAFAHTSVTKKEKELVLADFDGGGLIPKATGKLDLVVDEKGKVDVARTLGLQIVGGCF